MNGKSGASFTFGLERLGQLVEALPVGVFILAADGTAIYANQAAHALLGRGITAGDAAQNLGERFAAYRAGTNDLYPTSEMPIVRALAGERSTIDDMEIDRGGHRVALEVTGTPIVDGNSGVAFAVAVFQDITLRRVAERTLAASNTQLEREVARRTSELAATVAALEEEVARSERASRAKSVFLMNVSHELRTPLHQIIGFNDLVTERVTDERTRRLAEGAGNSARSLLEKVDALIELARADTQSTVAMHTRFDLQSAVAEVAESFEWSCNFREHLGHVHGDEHAVRQILSDVLRAGDSGAKAALSATMERLSDSARLRIHVKDAGLAKRVEALNVVFGDVPLDDSFRYQQQPLDLKLAVARTYARKHGGDISAIGADAVEVSLRFTI